MVETKHIINVQRFLLLTRGYTEDALRISNTLFLTTLEDKLKQFDKESGKDLQPRVFTHQLKANFEHGRIRTTVDFTYRYNTLRKGLSIVSVEGKLLKAQHIHSMEGKRNSELISAADLLKTLRQKAGLAPNRQPTAQLPLERNERVRQRIRRTP